MRNRNLEELEKFDREFVCRKGPSVHFFQVYSTITRNGIISDAFAAALVDELPYETVFDLLQYLKNEKEYLPWEEALVGFFTILDFFGSEPEAKPAQQFMLNLMENIYKNSSLEHITKEYKNDKLSFEIILEQRVIEAYCSLGSEDCINKYKKLFDEEVVGKCQGTKAKASQCVTLAAPLRAKTYCYGVSEGGKAAYNKKKASSNPSKAYARLVFASQRKALSEKCNQRNSHSIFELLYIWAQSQQQYIQSSFMPVSNFKTGITVCIHKQAKCCIAAVYNLCAFLEIYQLRL
ncbi:unnamed protein product [Strongylus vulgaris]|uniref:ERAP1-like C-terminal domain-containing protein n=1 Tax=Strongylus vulgaris TaxID=40348 RepID=A0A3P7JBA6_STRVU|nr:unnamed protein product [Strongylus vulgaris]